MLTNELVEVNDNYYYVDANGAMVRNTWVAIAADEDEEEDVDYRWYYFGPSGKAYKNSMGKSINGKKYGFDENGKMYFGFIGKDGESYNDDDDPIMQCTYYYGSNDDGARLQNAWLKYEDGISDTYDDQNGDEYDDDYFWFRFKSNGEKIVDQPYKKVNGQRYFFDKYGVMTTSFTDEDGVSAATQTRYFSENLEDGSMKKNAWIRTTMPDSWETSGDHDYDDDDHWFRTNNQGYLVANQTKKINSKWYAFDSDGVMLDSLVLISDAQAVKDASEYNENRDFIKYTADDTNASTIYVFDLTTDALFYFSGDEEKDGAMKTGSSIKIALADDDYTFKFQKTSGEAYHGISNNKLYDHGILQTADDDTYALVALNNADGSSIGDTIEGTYVSGQVGDVSYEGYTYSDDEFGIYLVNKSGTVCKKSTTSYKDANDTYWGVKADESSESRYVIGKFDTRDECRAWLQDGAVG